MNSNFLLLMNLLLIPELFYLISTNLNDKEKIFLTSCSKITFNMQSLIRLDLEYDLKEINGKLFGVKNIIIKDFSLDTEIEELLKNLIPESIVAHSEYAKFVSNNTNVKVIGNFNVGKIILYGYSYLLMKIRKQIFFT